ncbi:cation diffusion facilitator family transporter [Palleronia sp. LCG004]|uniref:cation diffusion facilitator family transporter n=1 Tax=Palleronia sp. LCG004 TaxID=3079304 RepID=UPI002941DFAB|nr:cation diffusion facilitator family transporter [Palleronia sp. LCG004]WOI56881.1 cation diffusion facilitator family transporter [Palleronia sp. LCG004]
MADSTSKDEQQSGSKSTVYAALAANLGIAVTKFIAAAISGSSAMLAEGIHSIVDTANQGLLLLGMARAKRPADEKHPFGYGREIYFWAFVVAVLIFALGSGLSIYEGIRAILHGESEHGSVPWIPLVVLSVSLCFEGYSLSVAIREFRQTRKGRGLWRDLTDMKDPSIFVVLAEDSAACAGLLVAAAGVLLAWLTGNPLWDAGASIVIGVILGIVAFLLAIEVKGLLVGEATDPDLVERVETKVASLPEIDAVNDIRTLHLGPHEILLTMSLDVVDDVPSQRIEALVTEIETNIQERFPDVERIFIEVQSRKDHMSLETEAGTTS